MRTGIVIIRFLLLCYCTLWRLKPYSTARVAKEGPESQDVLGSREITEGSGDSSEGSLDEHTQK